MRGTAAGVFITVIGLALPAWLAVAAGAAPGQFRAGSRPAQGTPTVIIEPSPVPQPIFLPRSLANYDPHVPGALQTRGQGFLVKLTQAGRTACAPATHVLQDKAEGVADARPWAVLYSPHPEPELNLDLFVGEYVEVFGFSGLAPEECRSLSWQLLTVEALRRIILPPGH